MTTAAAQHQLNLTRPGGLHPNAYVVRTAAKAVNAEHVIERVSSGKRNCWVWLHTDADDVAAVDRLHRALVELWDDSANRVRRHGFAIVITRDGAYRVPPLPARPDRSGVTLDGWASLVHAVRHTDGALHLVDDDTRDLLIVAKLARLGEGDSQRVRELMSVLTPAGWALVARAGEDA